MDRIEVTCVTQNVSYQEYERIENIGGLNPNGTRWKVSQQRAIIGIEQKKWHFYINKNNSIIDIIIASNNGRKYLKTKEDDSVNSLWDLPDCP